MTIAGPPLPNRHALELNGLQLQPLSSKDLAHQQQIQELRCRGKDSLQGKRTTEVQVHAGNVADNPRAVQLPPCTASSENSVLASCAGRVSIRKAFDGAAVLLTGATGFVGSLVLEQLLRTCPGIKRVHVIVRPKRGCSAEERLDKLFQRSMWHLHTGSDGRLRPEVRAKIGIITGDTLLPFCGFSSQDRQRLAKEVDFVIHCAASISFDEHVQVLISNNYQATKNVVDLAASLGKLRAFVHLSTAYSNCDRPRGSHVEERIYPLDPTLLGRSSPRSNTKPASALHSAIGNNCTFGSSASGAKGAGNPTEGAMRCRGAGSMAREGSQLAGVVGRKKQAEGTPGKAMAEAVDALAAELMRLSADEASARVKQVLDSSNIPNAYFLSKRMTEVYLESVHSAEAFPVCIVRPSLVGCTARFPHPGYFGNNAGPTAVALAFSLGIATFTSHQAKSVFDVVPGDICASTVLAAAAATAQGRGSLEKPLVLHSCTSTTNPENLYGWWDHGYRYWSVKPPPVRLSFGEYPRMDRGVPPVGIPERSWIFIIYTAACHAKFWLISALLRLLGYATLSYKLWTGWLAWRTYNTSKLDFNLFFCSRNAQQLERLLPEQEAAAAPLVWRAGVDDWAPYLRCHFDQIRHFHFKQAGYEPVLTNGRSSSSSNKKEA